MLNEVTLLWRDGKIVEAITPCGRTYKAGQEIKFWTSQMIPRLIVGKIKHITAFKQVVLVVETKTRPTNYRISIQKPVLKAL